MRGAVPLPTAARTCRLKHDHILPSFLPVLWNRSTSSGLALLLVALALIAGQNGGPVPLFGSESLQRMESLRLNAKASARFAPRNEAEALSMIRRLAEEMVDGSSTVGESELRLLSKQLSVSSLITLLNEHALWTTKGRNGDSDQMQWVLWCHLSPLRTSLLSSLAALDVEQALARFGSEASVFIKAAAEEDGARTFQAWMSFRDEWRTLSLGRIYPDTDGFPTLEEPSVREEQIMASLTEGWASHHPEAAWDALFREIPGRESAIAVGGLFKGLEQGSDWADWAERLGELEWSKVHEDSDQKPECLAAVGLASRWIRDEPEAALLWLHSSKESWNREGFEGLEAPSFEWGTSGRQEYMSAHAFVIYEWLNEQPAAALSWLSRADPIHRPDTVMEDVIEWARIPPMEKIELIQSMQTAQSKEKAALQVARESSRSSWLSPDHRTEFAELKKSLASVDGIRESVKNELLGIGER